MEDMVVHDIYLTSIGVEHLLYFKHCSKCCRPINKQERYGPCFHGAYGEKNNRPQKGKIHDDD